MSTEDIYTIQDKQSWSDRTLADLIMDYLASSPSTLRGCIAYLKDRQADEIADEANEE